MSSGEGSCDYMRYGRHRSAAGLFQNDDSMRDSDDKDHLPNSAFAIMNARPEPLMEEPHRLPGVPEIAYNIP